MSKVGGILGELGRISGPIIITTPGKQAILWPKAGKTTEETIDEYIANTKKEGDK